LSNTFAYSENLGEANLKLVSVVLDSVGMSGIQMEIGSNQFNGLIVMGSVSACRVAVSILSNM
jgi:hypothetical protein